MTPRDYLLAAADRLSEAFRTLDEIGPALAEPERSACLTLRDELAGTQRRLRNVVAFLGAERKATNVPTR